MVDAADVIIRFKRLTKAVAEAKERLATDERELTAVARTLKGLLEMHTSLRYGDEVFKLTNNGDLDAFEPRNAMEIPLPVEIPSFDMEPEPAEAEVVVS